MAGSISLEDGLTPTKEVLSELLAPAVGLIMTTQARDKRGKNGACGVGSLEYSNSLLTLV